MLLIDSDKARQTWKKREAAGAVLADIFTEITLKYGHFYVKFMHKCLEFNFFIEMSTFQSCYVHIMIK